MLRNDIQVRTGLTRKAIEYYEEKGLIKPTKLENGYRDYSDEDLNRLVKITSLRKIGMNIADISMLFNNEKSMESFLREKEYRLMIDKKRLEVLELIAKGESENNINHKLALIELEETVYEKIIRAFPGYFGQSFFMTYRTFLDEPLNYEKEEYYKKYVEYLDSLPQFELTEEEKIYMDDISSSLSLERLEEVNDAKFNAINNPTKWFKDNEEYIFKYEAFKNSEEYQKSTLKGIQDKLKVYMKENKYYEIAIPLIRKFSKSYDEYYKKLLKANETYLEFKN